MTQRIQQTCPLCKGPATFLFFDYNERKSFDCKACGQYIITRTVESKVAEFSEEHLDQIRKLVASTNDETIVEIARAQQDSLNGVTAEVIKRSSRNIP